MRFSTTITLLGGFIVAHASLEARRGGGGGGGGGDDTSSITSTASGSKSCPAIWTAVSKELTSSFVSNGQCTDLARAAIRYAFHDAGTFGLNLPFYAPAAGGADGSIMMVPSEINRPENNGLQAFNTYLTGLYNKYHPSGVGAADLVYFAGHHAVVSCPGGPTVKTLVGRKDARSDQPSPEGMMPPGFGKGSDHDSLLSLFQNKGFDARDLAALVGAHSTSKALGQQSNGIPKNAPQDSTPGVWDVKFYQETYSAPTGVYRFQSDINLSDKKTTVGKEFNGFVNNQGKWTGKFADAMYRLSILGIPSSDVAKFIDCTSALPASTQKRRFMDAPRNDRAR